MASKKNRYTPPLVGLGHLRRAHGYTLRQVVDGVEAITGHAYQVGTISAIETGAERPSDDLLAALLEFYGLTGKPNVHPNPRLVPQPSKVAAA